MIEAGSSSVCLFVETTEKSSIDVGTMYMYHNTSPEMHWPYECEDPFYNRAYGHKLKQFYIF